MFKKIGIIIAVFLGIIILIETGLQFYYGSLSPEEHEPNFKLNYLDIYDNFFEKVDKNGEQFYVPQRLTNVAQKFLVVKNPKKIRIFIAGGSIAELYYANLEQDLEKVFPERKFEIINCGMGGYDSFRVGLIVKEIAAYDPDLIIVLSGNNEFYDKVKINPKIYHFNRSLRRFWVYRKPQDFLFKWFQKKGLLQGKNRDKVADYKRNIQVIAKIAEKKGIPLILSTLPVNFSDCPPSGIRPDNKHFFFGLFLLKEGNYSKAKVEFKKFLNIEPDNPFGFFFLGKAEEGKGNHGKAKEKYFRSLELSEWNRATPSSNEVIRQVCRNSSSMLVDLDKVFREKSPNGLLGREHFYDNCHWWEAYYSLVSKEMIKKIFEAGLFNLSSKNFNLSFLSEYSFFGSKLGNYGYYSSLISCNHQHERYIERQIEYSVWEVFKGPAGLSERALSYFKTLYFLSPEALWDVQYLKEKLWKTFFESDCEKEEQMVKDLQVFEEKWAFVLYHIGETYYRLNLNQKAEEIFKKAVGMDTQLEEIYQRHQYTREIYNNVF